MVIHVKYLAVQGRGDIEQVERYFLGVTTTVESAESDGNVFAVLRTEADTDARAQRVAEDMAARYASGLYAAKVYDSPKGLLPIGASDEIWYLNR